MSQSILLGKSGSRRAYSQDFWVLEDAVDGSDTWFLREHRVRDLDSPVLRENRPSGGVPYYYWETWESGLMGPKDAESGSPEFWVRGQECSGRVVEEFSTCICVRCGIDGLKGKRIDIPESQGRGK